MSLALDDREITEGELLGFLQNADNAGQLMAQRLCARNAGRYLSPLVVVSRLQSEFAYVEVDEEGGRRHVRGLILQLQKMAAVGLIPVDKEYVERLKKAQRASVYVIFGDDPGSEAACLSAAIIPGEPLFLDYLSRAHAEAARPVLVRCAAVLGYDIIDNTDASLIEEST